MNLISLSDGHVDILRNVLRREIQKRAAGDVRDGELINYDQAAHLFTIYDLLCDIASKWNRDLPQIGCRPILGRDGIRPLLKGVHGVSREKGIASRLYLARDGNMKNIPAVD